MKNGIGLVAGFFLLTLAGCSVDSPEKVGASSTTLSNSEISLPTDCSVGDWTDSGSLAINDSSDGDFELFVFDLSARVLNRLTENEAVDRWPKWSPDGSKIMFFSDRDGDFEIYVMELGNGALTQLTDNNSDDGFASWSPDGAKIAFGSNRDGDWEIYVADSDGGDVEQLTYNSVDDHTPVWSPNGELIAFNSYRLDGYRMWLMNSDGSGQVMIDVDVPPGFPVWSTIGNFVAFNSSADGVRAVGVVDISGIEPLRIMPLEGGWPVWAPDSGRIAFASPRCGRGWEIFLANSDGTNVVATGILGSPISWRR